MFLFQHQKDNCHVSLDGVQTIYTNSVNINSHLENVDVHVIRRNYE